MLNAPSLLRNADVSRTLIALLKKGYSIYELKRAHALLTTSGLSHDYLFVPEIFSAFSSSGDVDYAHRVLHSLSSPTASVWNVVVRGYSNSRNPEKSFSVFVKMLSLGVSPDHMTYPFLVKAASRLSDRELGCSIHAGVVKTGYVYDIFIGNSLIHMYGSCKDIVNARKLFEEMPMRNLVSWNSIVDGYAKSGDMSSARKTFDSMRERDVRSWSSLIDGYVKSGEYEEAIGLFEQMIKVGPKANEVTMVSVLCACAHLGALDQGKIMHRYIIENELPLTLTLRTSLVDMYAKCGAVNEAWEVFCGMPANQTDVLIWNTMIGGLANHGLNRESFELFDEMQGNGVNADEITYLCLLSACSHGGLVKEAWYCFECLCKSGMAPKSEHYACMVDTLARAGQVAEAYEFISKMPIEPTASMLGALLSGCINHGKLDLAEVVGRRLIELQPDHDGRYIGLSNVYATVQRWGDARSMREAMENRGVKKFPGFSVVEMSGSRHRFMAHDKTHPNSEEIYTMLQFVVSQMKCDFDDENQDYCLYNMGNI